MPCLNGEIAPTIFANPHCVRLSVPELGFGDDLDATVQFCLERGQELRTGCFSCAELAVHRVAMKPGKPLA
jgi:hypothetical protein